MTPTQIAADIERGIEIRAEIKKLEAELKGIEKRLESAGLQGHQIPLQDEDREGRQFLARSPKHIIPVIFESDQIAKSFKPNSVMHKAVTELAGEHFALFYKDVREFQRVPKDGNAFRKLARELLGVEAPPFLSACVQRKKDGIPKSRTVIAWDNDRDPEAIPA